MKILKFLSSKRTAFHLLFPLACLIFAHPNTLGLLIGISLTLLGEGIRVLSAGYITKNEVLTTSGPYSWTRNPLYLGTFFIGLGICFLSGYPAIVFPIYLVLFALIYIPTIKSEEDFLTKKFGKEYEIYKNSVPIFFPFPPFKFRPSAGYFSWSRVKENKELRSLFTLLLLLSLFILKFFLQPR
ncbi:isoprenylcysteine carboxylmethyltransferase family protein [bacterium]|nr:isoprenylcysteine carboxylmethyltransferase family protein [bacterium]